MRVVGVRGHRAELEDRERPAAAAHSHLAEEDRAGRVELDRDRDDSEERSQQHERETRDDEVERALEEQRRVRQACRRQAEERHPLDRVDAHVRAEHVEEPRHDVDLHVELVEAPDQLQRLVVRRLRERDDHALDVERVDELRQLVAGAEHRQLAEVVLAFARVVVDEAEHVDPVLRMLQQLASHHLPDVARADDERVLEVRVGAPHDRARDSCGASTTSTIASSQKRPSLGKLGCANSVTHASANSSHAPTVSMLKTPKKSSTVEWFGALLVARVEAVESAEHDPERQRQREEQHLHAGAHLVGRPSLPLNTSCVNENASRIPTTSAAASARRTTQPRACPLPARRFSSSARVRSSRMLSSAARRRGTGSDGRGTQRHDLLDPAQPRRPPPL